MSVRTSSRWGVGCLGGAALVLLATAGHASERSQILLAKGELAYARGERTEARAFLEQAVAADPSDALAYLALGETRLALGDTDGATQAFERARALRPDLDAAREGLERARGTSTTATKTERLSGTVGEIGRLASMRQEQGRRWGLTLTTGLQYDSNVNLAPHNFPPAGFARLPLAGRLPLTGFDRKDDGAFVLSGGGHFDVVDRPDFLFRLEYDLYQTLHMNEHAWDFRSQRIQGTISHALRPDLWIGVQGGYNHYTLGPHSYLGEPFVMPFVSLLEGRWGLTQVNYRHSDTTYFSVFHELRDGPIESAGIRQDLFFAGQRYLSGGYQFTSEDPTRSIGNDWTSYANELYIGGGLPLWWGFYFDGQYLYRNEDYAHLNSYALLFEGVLKKRQDDGHYFYASLSHAIVPHVSVAIVYYGTINNSNVALFEYQRHVVATLLQVTY
jgi:hypothetical protein